MKLTAILPAAVRLLVLWFITLAALATWYVFYVVHIPPMAAAHFRPGREMPSITTWVIEAAISWQDNYNFWTIAAVAVSASIVTERASRGRWRPGVSRSLRAVPSIYGAGLLVISAGFLYVVYATNA